MGADRALATSYRLSVSIFSGSAAIFNGMFQAKWPYLKNNDRYEL